MRNYLQTAKRCGCVNKTLLLISAVIAVMLLTASCMPIRDTSPRLERATRIFDGDEKIVLRAVKSVLRERDFGEAVETDKGRLETDYVIQDDWRTKVVATVKQIGRKKCEVVLSVLTEKKSASGWQSKPMMGKEQYETFLGEIEIQIYRELSAGE